MDLGEEVWLPVVGAEGHYEVSDLGRVRSVDRALVQRDRYGGERVIHRQGRLLSTTPNLYRASVYVVLQVGQVRTGRTRQVHVLVLTAFVGPRPPGLVGCHRNGDFRDNRLANLRWDTQRSNLLDQQIHGTSWARNKTRCPLGHPLAEPNLVAYKVKIGHRLCLSCCRARAEVNSARRRGQPVPDLQEVADRKYALLLSSH